MGEGPDAGSTIAALIAAPLLAPTLALVASVGSGTELVSTIQVTPATTVDHSLVLVQMVTATPAMRRLSNVATSTTVDPTAARDHVVLKVQRLLLLAMQVSMTAQLCCLGSPRSGLTRHWMLKPQKTQGRQCPLRSLRPLMQTWISA